MERHPEYGPMILSLAQAEVFFLVLARIAGVFIQAPLLSSRSFVSSAKIAFAIWLTLILWFVVPVTSNLPGTPLSLAITLVAEVALGFLIGFVSNLIFIAVQTAGEIMDMQMGLSVATALDPVFGAVISVVGRLTFYVALVVFVVLDGHHMILSAFHQSFSVIPAGQFANFASYGLVTQLMQLGGVLWMTTIKLAAPIVLLIFLSDFTFGIVSRVAPQVNVFMLGFQVKPMLGLFAFLVTLPFLIKQIGNMIGLIGQELVKLLIVIK